MNKRILIYSFLFLVFQNVHGQINLVGLTRGNSAKIIKYEVTGNSLAQFHDIGSGRLPWYSDLLEEDGKLYGITENGGTSDEGTIFSFNPVTSEFTILHNFNGTNGGSPHGSLIKASNDIFYGLTTTGGSLDSGTLFSYDPATSTFETLHHFNGPNGRSSYGSLIQASSGLLYGMTEAGGAHYMGTVFSFDIATEILTTIHNFNLHDGRSPYGNLIQASNGLLYGMTQFGGNDGYGTIFSINPPDGNDFETRHDFDWANGAWPNSTLVEHNGKLYGMTESGGDNFGVIFYLDLPNDHDDFHPYSSIHSFNQTDGRSPYGSLLKASDDMLYGMTFRGGANDKGVLFSINPSLNTFDKLQDFSDAIGANPPASLIEMQTSLEPLPLKVLSYTVKADGNRVIIELVVDQETDIERYEAQRSSDGTNFSTISSLNAQNSNAITNYIFTDDDPLDLNYYRVRIVEKFLQDTFTEIKQVSFNRHNFRVNLKTNPVISSAILDLNMSKSGLVAFTLFDLKGRTIKQWKNLSFIRGEHQVQLDMNSIISGGYFLEVRTTTEKRVLKLIK